MATATDARAGTAPLELTLIRVLNATRTLVWKAWTDPEHVGRWGPGRLHRRACAAGPAAGWALAGLPAADRRGRRAMKLYRP